MGLWHLYLTTKQEIFRDVDIVLKKKKNQIKPKRSQLFLIDVFAKAIDNQIIRWLVLLQVKYFGDLSNLTETNTPYYYLELC